MNALRMKPALQHVEPVRLVADVGEDDARTAQLRVKRSPCAVRTTLIGVS